jgi:plastocyanin
MNRIRYVLAAAAALAALTVAPAASPATTSLVATVGPGFTITLTKGGKRVTTLRPGMYRITVRDRASDHNFRLRGPGSVNKATGIGRITTVVWTVRLRAGKYTYVCDPHASSMRGSFTVR